MQTGDWTNISAEGEEMMWSEVNGSRQDVLCSPFARVDGQELKFAVSDEESGKDPFLIGFQEFREETQQGEWYEQSDPVSTAAL